MKKDPSGKRTKPLLKDIEAQVDEEEDEETKKKREFENSLWSRVVQGVAIAAIVLNLLAIIFVLRAIIIIAGLFGIVIGAGVVYFQEELKNGESA